MKTKTFQGVTFKIDRPKGYVKTWEQPSGPPKVFVYPVDYGFFPGIKGEDGEGLDAFVGDAPQGHLECFQKLKKNDKGQLVLDETKFLVGVNDRQREEIYRLYGSEVWARRVFHDVNELETAAHKFKGQKKERYQEKIAELETNVHKDQGTYRFNDSAQRASLADKLTGIWDAATRRPNATGSESSLGTFFQDGITG